MFTTSNVRFRRPKGGRGVALLAAACAGAVAGLTQHAAAAVDAWTGATGDQQWSTAGNWTAGVPTTTSDVLFSGSNASTVLGVPNNFLTNSLSINSLTYNQTNTTGSTLSTYTTSIANGSTLTITGTNGLHAGVFQSGSAAAAISSITTLTGGGSIVLRGGTVGTTLAVTEDTANGGTSVYTNTNATLDMSGLSSFSGTMNAVLVGAAASGTAAAGQRSSGTLILAATNAINASSVIVGWDNTNGRTNTLSLGHSNNINADTFYVGRDKAQGLLNFAPSFTGGASLVLRSLSGTGRVNNFIVGDLSPEATTGTSQNSTVDFRGGTVDAQINNLALSLGETSTGSGVPNSTLYFAGGTIDATTITLAKSQSTNGANAKTIATYNQSAGATKAGNLIIAQQAGASLATGTFNLTGGTLAVTGNVTSAGGSATLNIAGGTATIAGSYLAGTGTTNLVVNGGSLASVANLGSATMALSNLALTSGSIGTVNNIYAQQISGAGAINNLTGSLNVNANSSQTFDGTIAGAGGVNFQGGGTLTFTGANTYTGVTTVASGNTLALTGNGAVSGTKAIVLADSATFDVSGVTNQPYTLNAGQNLSGSNGGNAYVSGRLAANAATLTPGGTGVAGNINFNSDLTLNDNSTLNYDLNFDTTPGSGVNDLITVGGNLTFNGTTAVSINRLSSDLQNGAYELFTYNGQLNGTAANLVATGPGAAQSRHTFTFDTSTPGAVFLDVAGSGPANLVWTGAASSNWNVAADVNWHNNDTNAPDKFFQQDNVTFDDTSTQTNVTLVGTLLPSNVEVNAAQNYLFTGSGKISGQASLTKDNTGTLTLDNTTPNDYTGQTTINGGTLQIGNNDANGSLPASSPINDYGTLAVARTDNLTLPNVISGGGGLLKTGTNTLTLSGANSYSGTTVVTAGVLKTLNPTALGDANGTTTIAPGATLDVGGQNLGAEQVIVGGTGAAGAGAAIVNTGADQINALQFVTLSGDTTFGGSGGRWDIRNVTGSTATLDMGGHTLTKAGTNYVALVGVAVANPGNINVNAGTFSLESTTAFTGATSANTINVGSDGLLQFWGLATPLPYAINTAGGTVKAGSGTANNLAGPIALAATTNFDVSSGVTLTATNTLSGAGGLTKINPGTLSLGAANTYTGVTTVTGGLVAVRGLGNGGSPSGLGVATSDPSNLILNGGGISYVGSTPTSTDRQFTFGSNGATLDASGATGAPINFTSTAPVTYAGTTTRTLTLSGSNTDSNVLNALLTNPGPGQFLNVNKNGPGTWVLTNANTFNGTVTISTLSTNNQSNTLVVRNNNALGANGNTVNVTNGGTGGQLQLDGANAPGGGLSLNYNFITSGNGVSPSLDLPNNPGVIRSLTGNNTLAGSVQLTSGAGATLIGVDTGSSLLVHSAISILSGQSSRNLEFGGGGFGAFDGSLANTGSSVLGVIKGGTGTWDLQGTAAYNLTGGFQVLNGTLLVDRAIAAAAGPVTVSTGSNGTGTLGGGTTGAANPGAIAGAVTLTGGNLSPGANGTSTTRSLGVLSVGNLAFTGGSTTSLIEDITGPANGLSGAGLTYDQVVSTGTASLSGSGVVLTLNDANAAMNAGDQYFLYRGNTTTPNTISFVNYDGSSIDGSGATPFTDANGNTYTLNTNFTDPATGDTDVVLTSVSGAVPEPTALSAVLLGTGAVLSRRRRRRNKTEPKH